MTAPPSSGPQVKHLLYEHQNNITTLKTDGEMALKLQQDDFRKRESDLSKDKRGLKVELKEQELSHQDVIRQLKLEQAKEVTKLRQEYELQVRATAPRCTRSRAALGPGSSSTLRARAKATVG